MTARCSARTPVPHSGTAGLYKHEESRHIVRRYKFPEMNGAIAYLTSDENTNVTLKVCDNKNTSNAYYTEANRGFCEIYTLLKTMPSGQ
ncbi:hypothetical protein H920_15368 [Fukomys damarensis]|uniref:Uncharacterized protein n=1 Tax=Fukomys damarensis TaxID=885580 RepID=A0A091CYA3_FUKDA|nr:hypothetical protein H920_15368 [Fukomys damarensis]